FHVVNNVVKIRRIRLDLLALRRLTEGAADHARNLATRFFFGVNVVLHSLLMFLHRSRSEFGFHVEFVSLGHILPRGVPLLGKNLAPRTCSRIRPRLTRTPVGDREEGVPFSVRGLSDGSPA